MWRPDLYITSEQFRERLKSLRRMEAAVLPFDEAITRLQKNSLPDKSVAITFDDGFHDLSVNGFPALREFGYPATLYLTTHYCGYRRPIIGLILDYLLWKSDQKTITLPEYGIPGPMLLGSYDKRLQVVTKLQSWMDSQKMSTLAKDDTAQAIAQQLGIDYGDILRHKIVQILSPEDVAVAASAGIDVQMHTHRHRTSLEHSLFVKEIVENRNRISELTGKAPVHFCYPSGVYRPEFFSWLKECNVRSATTCDKGLASPSSEILRLPRLLDDSRMNPFRFEGAVSGLVV